MFTKIEIGNPYKIIGNIENLTQPNTFIASSAMYGIPKKFEFLLEYHFV